MNRTRIGLGVLAVATAVTIISFHGRVVRNLGIERSVQADTPTPPSTLTSPHPVVVELFTSEGCSSCPPADALLDNLSQTQSVTGAVIVPLAEHVDYWNYLGWRDPYSSRPFSARQSEYATTLHQDDVYTPEAVVNGDIGLVGSDKSALVAAIESAANQVSTPVSIGSMGATHDSVTVTVTVGKTKIPADVYLAVTEDGLSQQIGAGENSGRKLRQNGVVRLLQHIGQTAGHDAVITTTVLLDKRWIRKNLHLVTFVQRHQGAITGAATTPIARP